MLMSASKWFYREDSSRESSIPSDLKLILGYLAPHKFRFLVASLLLVIASFALLVSPWFVGNIAESVVQSSLTEQWPLLSAWFLVLIVQAIAMFLGMLGASYLSVDLSAAIRSDLYAKINSTSHNNFFDSNKGAVVSLSLIHI